MIYGIPAAFKGMEKGPIQFQLSWHCPAWEGDLVYSEYDSRACLCAYLSGRIDSFEVLVLNMSIK